MPYRQRCWVRSGVSDGMHIPMRELHRQDTSVPQPPQSGTSQLPVGPLTNHPLISVQFVLDPAPHLWQLWYSCSAPPLQSQSHEGLPTGSPEQEYARSCHSDAPG